MFNQIKVILISFSSFLLSLPFTISGLSKFEKNEAKADWQPPGFVFGIVWPILYYLLGALNLKLYYSNIDKEIKYKNLYLSIIESVLQTLWLSVTGNYNNGRSIFQNIFGLFILTFISYYTLKVRLPALYNLKDNYFYYYIPYCIWICFALILNFQIVKKNLINYGQY